MIKPSRCAPAALLALVCVACSAPADHTAAGGAGDAASRADVSAAMQRYAAFIRTTSHDSLAALYATDGELLQPGQPPLRGPEAIGAFLSGFVQVRVDSAAMTSDTIEVFGDAAMLWGHYAQTVALGNRQAATYRGRFASEWRRQPDGRWLIRRMLVQPAPQ